MSELTKAYEPQAVEDKWYQFWLDGKFFVANEKSAKPAYSIVIPPPNVTGVLTMGHVLNNTIQDILSRKARMDGKEVLWLPGTDHAGIATQTVVERTLKKAGEIKHRDDLGREKFLERVWQWKEKHGGIIIQQLKKLGASCDWSRERFTMDPEYSRCVQKVFVELYKKGHIYRGKRMVNWDPVSLTALSDEEVIMKEQKGSLCYFKVEVAEAPGTFLTIATTRPETIPGDTAVAVNPKDTRYAHLIGKHIVRPLPVELPREQKLIPIIGDEHVEFEFGTGVLKVTPAHDKADFDIGLRHKLPQIEVIEANGIMNAAAGADLNGLDRFKARKVAVEKLTELGALEKEEPYTNNVGFSERTDVPIEPRLSEQWFLKYPSTEKSRAVVAEGKMKFHPDRWAKVYDHWMGGLQDWCISRQLWWGHRIPVWHGWADESDVADIEGDEGQDAKSERAKGIVEYDTKVPTPDGTWKESHWTRAEWNSEREQWYVWHCVNPGFPETESQLSSVYTQDSDVLDTWFSSWLWPFATMGWPEQTETLKKFYPTTDLVTGPDIIFFWVARMIMAGYEFMGDAKFGLPDAMPFKNVYFTGIIRDKQGRKMSKSLGNSPDPLDLIGKYGADALRFGVMRAAPLGQDILFDEQNVELGRNFCNKLWNACRFRQMQGGEVQGEIDPKLLAPDDKWILLKLDAALREIATAFADYKFSDATAVLYRFFWSEYCDWYIEASKAALQGGDAARKANTIAVIDFVLSHTLRMFHPFLPFITEELWHGMGYSEDMPENQGGKTIMFAPWPKPLDDDFKSHYALGERDEKIIEARNELIVQGRDLRRQANIPANKKVKFVFKRNGQAIDTEVLKLLLNAEAVEVNASFQPAKNVLAVRHEAGELFLPLEGLVDTEAEKIRLKKELEKIENEISKVEQKLANPNFTQKVPPAVLDDHKKRLGDWQGKREHTQAALKALES
ncbi:MAG TPA: valine--tRNA ligase [Pseudomonadales bacterium]|nr:valine--tRNA ligase [Pseudomonadales bacterium]